MALRYYAYSVFLALSAMWVALVVVCGLIPAYPVLGTSAQITVATVVSSALTAPILGAAWGTFAGFIYGGLIPFFNPATGIFGPLTFLSPTIAALMSGLFLFGRWKEAALVLSAQIIIWFANPFSWYQAMPAVSWEYWLAMVFIVVPPIRKWIIGAFRSRNPATLPVALWCLAWIARAGGDVITGNNIFVWVFGFVGPGTYMYWVPVIGYYAIADSLSCLAGAIIGTLVLVSLKTANIKFIALDLFESKMRS